MADPISVVLAAAAAGGAVGGVAGKVGEKVIDYLHNFLAGQNRRTEEIAAQRAAEFMAHFVARLALEAEAGRLRETPVEAVVQRLDEPDFAATLKSAVEASARTESRDKHQLLARAVATRLAAEPESINAIASTHATEVLPRLSTRHLEILGILVVLYELRPTAIEIMSMADGTDYARWVANQLAVHDLWIRPEDPDYLHLASMGCLVILHGRKDQLGLVLENGMELEHVRASWEHGLAWLRHESGAGDDLARLWESGFQRMRATPVGTQIGIAVHELRVEGWQGELQQSLLPEA